MPTGRVWKFADDINTDLMLPGPLLTASEPPRVTFVTEPVSKSISAVSPSSKSDSTPSHSIAGKAKFTQLR